jgi:hypothetical protein
MKFLMLSLLTAAVAMNPCPAHSGIVIYEFTGVLPAGASQHSQIQDGESWIATFHIDTNATDSLPGDPTRGIYDNNVVSGLLSFSGGYSQTLNTTGWETDVFNDRQVAGGFAYADAVGIYDEAVPVDFVVQAHLERSFPPPPILRDDSLPVPGVAFASQGDWINYFQLRFRDQVTGELVVYNAGTVVNTSFVARAVPEPGSMGIALMLCVVAAIGRRCRRGGWFAVTRGVGVGSRGDRSWRWPYVP